MAAGTGPLSWAGCGSYTGSEHENCLQGALIMTEHIGHQVSWAEKEIQHVTSWERIGTGNLLHPEGADMDLIWPASSAHNIFCCFGLRPLPRIATPEEARVFQWEGEGSGDKRKAEKLKSFHLGSDGNLFIIRVDWIFQLLKWDCSSVSCSWSQLIQL